MSPPAGHLGPSSTPGPGPAGATVLDHVAVAVEGWSEAWPRYAVDLGGEWASGGYNVGFGYAQLRYANGARLEILEPHQWRNNPFLRRFLDTNGPGPHHLTFKVPDIERALDACRDAGFDPVGVDLSDPGWKEAFLHPRQAMGIVVQLAQAAAEWSSPAPQGFPAGRRPEPASLEHLTHAVADMDQALALFRDLLGGTVRARGRAGDGSWWSTDLGWPGGPLGLRLVASSDECGVVAGFLDGRRGRLHHLALRVGDPGGVPGVTPTDSALGTEPGPAWVIAPEDNLGTRLVLRPPEHPASHPGA